MDLNLVVICGRLIAAPDHRKLDTETKLPTPVLHMLVMVVSDTPRRRVDVVPVELWNPPDDLLDGRLRSGTRVWVTGAVQRRFREQPPKGEARSRIEVMAHQVTICQTDDERVPA